jgi:hypothetical protein
MFTISSAPPRPFAVCSAASLLIRTASPTTANKRFKLLIIDFFVVVPVQRLAQGFSVVVREHQTECGERYLESGAGYKPEESFILRSLVWLVSVLANKEHKRCPSSAEVFGCDSVVKLLL